VLAPDLATERMGIAIGKHGEIQDRSEALSFPYVLQVVRDEGFAAWSERLVCQRQFHFLCA
jgi:hypothetical protein